MRRQLSTLLGGIILGVLALGASGRLNDADAMPPYPGLASQSKQAAAAVDHYMELRAGFAERGIDQPGGIAAGTQLAGSFNMLAICVDFSDHPSSTPAIKFDTLIFAQQGNSVRDYYHQVSYGTLTIVTVNLPSTLGWQRAPSTYAYYVNNNYALGSYPQNSQKLVEDLVDLVDPTVNFASYDNDGDGFVDGVIVVHAGTGAELSGSTSDVWSHKWGIMPRLKDGVFISDFSIQPEYWYTPGDITIGVYAHEIGHVFGLPDLYDTDNSSRGLARWSLMANGSWNGSLGNSPAHLDAWCRTQLGFCTPTVVNGSIYGASVPRIEDSAVVYRVWSSGTIGNEYFLVENRQKTGYDAALPGAGLLIWHIDETKSGNTQEWYPGHTSFGNYLVALEQADGLWELDKNLDNGDTGDPFPGLTDKRTFSAASTPSSDSYSGGPTYVVVTNISNSGLTMTCDFQVTLGTGIVDDQTGGSGLPSLFLTNSPNPFNPSTIIEYGLEKDGIVRLTLCNVLGQMVRDLVDERQPAGTHQVAWDGNDQSGHAVSSGVYLARMQSAGRAIVRKMILVR